MFRFLAFLLALALAAPAQAHPVPYSYLDLRYEGEALEGTLTIHDIDIAHELRIEDPAELRDPHHLIHRLEEIGASMTYGEIDPDIFGEELEQPGYERVERIAAVGAVVEKQATQT